MAFFKALHNTRNFEAVLGSLATAHMVNTILGLDARLVQDRYGSIRRALISAVHAVHVPWARVPEECKVAMRTAFLEYDIVYSTNYDLLLYWAMMAGDGEGFKDYFWSEKFDISNSDIWGDATRVLYLHGALHLYRMQDGGTYKDRAGVGSNLLDQFGKRDDLIPLFITEGSHEEKLRAIARSDYLSFALQEFARHDAPLVVFGQSLSSADQHIVDAINRWQDPEIAVGILPVSDATVIEDKARIGGVLPRAHLTFFDASTHPLGSISLRVDDQDD